MQNSDGRQKMGRIDNLQGSLVEISADAPSISVLISKIIKICYGRQKVAVEIQKLLGGGRKTENLINHTCFNLNNSRFHLFFKF